MTDAPVDDIAGHGSDVAVTAEALLTGCFRDRVVLVTGAAGDLGFGIAEAFWSLGARVILLDIDLALLRQRSEGLRRPETHWHVLGADVSDAKQVEHAVQDVLATFKRIDVLVNNAAAIISPSPVDGLSLEQWDKALAANLTGPFLLSRAVIPAMRQAKRGVIINVASQMAHVGSPGRSAYTASKAGLLGFTRTLALDHAREGIRIVGLSPGAVFTGRLKHLYGSYEAAHDALAPLHPVRRMGTVQEIALSAVFLASDAASFITGTDLIVDGGYTAQ